MQKKVYRETLKELKRLQVEHGVSNKIIEKQLAEMIKKDEAFRKYVLLNAEAIKSLGTYTSYDK